MNRDHRPTELQCQATLVAAAKRGGWRVHAERTSRTHSGGYATAIQGHAGWPDLVLAHPTRGALVVELKRKPGRVTPEQRQWLDTLNAAGITATVWWVPDELDARCQWLAAS